MLIADELTSNALRHGGRPVATALSRVGDQWLIAVSDILPEVPPAPAEGRDPGLGGLRPLPRRRPLGPARLVAVRGRARRCGPSSQADPPALTPPTARLRAGDSRVTCVSMSLVEQMDTVTDASAGTVDRHATTETFESTDPAPAPSSASSRCTTPTPCARPSTAPARPPTQWAELGFDGRKQRLAAYRGYLARRMNELADLVHRENGKPHADAILEITLAIDHLAWAGAHARKTLGPRKVTAGMLAGQPRRLPGVPAAGRHRRHRPVELPGVHADGLDRLRAGRGQRRRLQAVGVHPRRRRVAGRRLAGRRPDAADAFQVVTGFGDTGAALCRAGVDKLAFTGSAPTGKKVMAACAETLTPVLMELGGKDAMIVDDDADVVAAADAAVWGAMSNAGQTCIGIERVYATSAGLRPVRRRGHRAG